MTRRTRAASAPAICPDCTARLRPGRTLRHDATCPVGADTDATAAADQAWFDAHPFATAYRRELTYSERALVTTTGRVTVTRIRDGLRVRRYEGARAVLDVDADPAKAARP